MTRREAEVPDTLRGLLDHADLALIDHRDIGLILDTPFDTLEAAAQAAFAAFPKLQALPARTVCNRPRKITA